MQKSLLKHLLEYPDKLSIVSKNYVNMITHWIYVRLPLLTPDLIACMSDDILQAQDLIELRDDNK